MEGNEPTDIDCPYCGEVIEIEVDRSVSEQQYVEDCSVCCRPIVIDVRVDDADHIEVTARREDD